ncbi:hypothetical protein [Streptomyces sp. NPDC060194]|uniref:hypothetical protein n=1 Tax=Streptomyces sp. NPDC060194 TaxID=3347069 RepID=UPI003656CE90
MSMNSAPHLLNEDRQEFERTLDEALRTASGHPDFEGLGNRLNPEQLRTLALNATALIMAPVAGEYGHFVQVRADLRDTAAGREQRASEGGLTASLQTVAAAGEVAAGSGAGLAAVVAVLTPVLAGAAAAIFLLVGYALKLLTPEPGLADTMLTAGWIFGAVTAVAILVAGVGLLLTALRNASTSLGADEYGVRSEELDRARDAWREALLQRGILPFLREALAAPESSPTGPEHGSGPVGRIPHLGYHSPGFSSPDGGQSAGHRPSFSSPDYSSPDFGGPETKPE